MNKSKPSDPIEMTDLIKEEIKKSFGDSLKITFATTTTREKGYYGVCFAIPSKSVRNALTVDREILVLISTFEDQQTRTIQTAKDIIAESSGRLDSSTFIVVHRDPRGNNKLRKWAREQSLAVLPLYYQGDLPSGDNLLRALSYELYSYDVFDVTGPVADDLHFYGRREEARDLAKKLQSGQIRSCFGIRKIGKTSILHRVVNEVDQSHDCTTFLIDAQSDAVFSLNAASLINSLAYSLERAEELGNYPFEVISAPADITAASERLRSAIFGHNRHVLFVFDEIDYLTPTSPTAPHWRTEFNPFWRNIRAVYQASAIKNKNFSLLISGVSSKWFAEESIDGIENAALSFVPEEYLSPLPRGASGAMIRRLGRSAGLNFNDQVADQIAASCADMPFWIRKACSFIHSKVDIGLRPFELQLSLVKTYLEEFISSDGTAMSEVALAHLFRVYPELRNPAELCAADKTKEINPRMLRILQKYGVLTVGPKVGLSGQMIYIGLSNLRQVNASAGMTFDSESAGAKSDYTDWADELAIISRRRNILELKLRGVVGNFIRYSALTDSKAGTAKERLLKCLDNKRQADLQRHDLDEVMSKLYWLELIGIIKKEWILFEKMFGDKANLDKYSSVVNERPDAHAKPVDVFDTALHRRAVSWFEDRLGRV